AARAGALVAAGHAGEREGDGCEGRADGLDRHVLLLCWLMDWGTASGACNPRARLARKDLELGAKARPSRETGPPDDGGRRHRMVEAARNRAEDGRAAAGMHAGTGLLAP